MLLNQLFTDIVRYIVIGTFTIIGVVLGYYLNRHSEEEKRAKIEIDSVPLLDRFSNSIRLKFPIKHIGGSLPAINAVCYLDVSANKPLSKFLIPKEDGCMLEPCKLCDNKYFLVSPEEKEIRSEALPWAISIPAGFGLDKIAYRHVTNLPVGGECKVNLFDIYKASQEGFYLIKLHSEYGTCEYPRACIKLPINRGSKADIEFTLKVVAENIREPTSLKLKIKKENADYIIETTSWRRNIKELTENIKSLPLGSVKILSG
jgi:hypothetical protein